MAKKSSDAQTSNRMISDQDLITAALAVVTAGPLATPQMVMEELHLRPPMLPLDVARFVAVSGRVIAQRIASLCPQNLGKESETLLSRSNLTTLQSWARELDWMKTAAMDTGVEEMEDTTQDDRRGAVGGYVSTVDKPSMAGSSSMVVTYEKRRPRSASNSGDDFCYADAPAFPELAPPESSVEDVQARSKKWKADPRRIVIPSTSRDTYHHTHHESKSSVTPVMPTANPCYRESGGNVYVFDSTRKSEWHLKIPSGVAGLIIGDSNLKLVNEVPRDWVLNSFPGAKIHHVTRMLNDLATAPPADLQCIAVQVGINNRDDAEVPHDEILSMMEALNRLDVRALYMAISVAPGMPPHARKAIMAINRTMQTHFHTTFIYALEDAEIDAGKPSRIHYTQDTQRRIIHAILKRAKYLHAIDTHSRHNR